MSDGTGCSIQESVLMSIKQLLGVSQGSSAFDLEIMMDINGALTVLYQLGYGKTPRHIKDSSIKWTDIFTDDEFNDLVVNYIYLKVKLMFDPPQSGVLHEAMEREITEFEWRLNVQAETPAYGKDDEG